MRGLRYVIQVAVMMTDLMIIAAAIYSLYYASIPGFFITMMGLTVWYKEGPFMSWRPSVIKQFMANAKKAGL